MGVGSRSRKETTKAFGFRSETALTPESVPAFLSVEWRGRDGEKCDGTRRETKKSKYWCTTGIGSKQKKTKEVGERRLSEVYTSKKGRKRERSTRKQKYVNGRREDWWGG